MENQMLDQSEIGVAIISEMANTPSQREKLIAALAKNGVTMDIEVPNDELYTAIFSGITYSKAFRTDVKKAVYSYLQELENEGDNLSFLGSTATTGLQQAASYAQQQQAKTTTTTTKKKFADTTFGKFLGGFLTPETASNLANVGINAINQKITSRADQATIDQGIQFQVEKAETLDKEIQTQQARKKWVVPVIIASSIVVLAIIGYVIYKNRKK